jgi:hypothetical protein
MLYHHNKKDLDTFVDVMFRNEPIAFNGAKVLSLPVSVDKLKVNHFP